MISTSPVRISCVILGDEALEAVQVLHAGLGLDAVESS
jgi:aspartokinase